ncbi:MAG: ATP-dependent zinc metalloprotease FtsH [Acidobacteria bacterium]|uniref:ATP-dependent zinc metalloprotease FtsH n=1 Tax=Candidatus Polarisedimenticola svalbardensis TaxID=2886004 RepID=A0A8J6XWA7_9BACT|nr:ATP-dependent zinc metalloprotease FtsH [Candidatus Polarisedimenticola svalbardensis]
MNAHLKTLVIWLVVIAILVIGYQIFNTAGTPSRELDESEFYALVEADEIQEVKITGDIIGYEIEGEYKTPRQLVPGGREYKTFKTYVVKNESLTTLLRERGVNVKTEPPRDASFLTLLLTWSPILLILGIWIFFMRQMQSGGNKAMSFGKSRAKLTSSTGKKVTFKDVAGVEEAKEELDEIIAFLKEPQKFQKLGGKIPKGVLLMGPPGTGKTLLARAIAGEANVPFFSISGSDFVEMFVGVGASRVRDLFDQGKKNAPCIIFIDEIDAVGRHRGAGLGGGHDEREQTLNQLLVEMDGFETNDGVILVAATNRPDVLDPALMRPGRFDRQVVVGSPDVRGREEILKVHCRKIPMDSKVDLAVIARSTPGFSGADLANLVNEAALYAARLDRSSVMMEDFEVAKDKVLMGVERKSLIISDDERRATAYHEAGHALIAFLLPGADPVHKVTIIPRGRALGLTMQLPEDDKHTYSKKYLEATLTVLMGGRVSEEIHIGQITTGAGNDIERASGMARKMVCEWGMSEKLGPITFGKKEEQIFLGREISQHRDYSEDTAQEIDREVRQILDRSYAEARRILEANREVLIRIAEALLERESLNAGQIDLLSEGKELPAIEAVRSNQAPAAAEDSTRPESEQGRDDDSAVLPTPGNQPA